jgi:predicted enzyme related to lactoylglutathione lyase
MDTPVVAVRGIGGVFFRAKDPESLTAWYADNLGLEPEPDGHVVLRWASGESTGPPGATVWATFPADTTYFGTDSPYMVNYLVDDLDLTVERLRAAGAPVEDVQDLGYGRFAWATDPEGNRFELWEPAAEPEAETS